MHPPYEKYTPHKTVLYPPCLAKKTRFLRVRHCIEIRVICHIETIGLIQLTNYSFIDFNRCLIHSDQGVHYTSSAFTSLLSELNMLDQCLEEVTVGIMLLKNHFLDT